jgi:hypothetical protein
MSKKAVSIRLPTRPTRTVVRHAGQEHWIHQRSPSGGGVERQSFDRARDQFSSSPSSMNSGWMDGPSAIRRSIRRTWPKRVMLVHE